MAQLGSDTSVLVAARFHGLPDFLAFGAYREPLRVAARYPYLAAECNHRCPHHHGLGQLVLRHVVGEALVVALLNAMVRALLRALVDNSFRAGTLLLTHVGQSRQRSTQPI